MARSVWKGPFVEESLIKKALNKLWFILKIWFKNIRVPKRVHLALIILFSFYSFSQQKIRTIKNIKRKDVVDVCTILEKCSIDEISKYLLDGGINKKFPDITTRQ